MKTATPPIKSTQKNNTEREKIPPSQRNFQKQLSDVVALWEAQRPYFFR